MRVHYSLLASLAIATVSVVGEPSPGCGKAPTKLKNGMYSVTVNGVARPFIVHLPENYDNTKPYRTIFAFHATGGTANDTAKAIMGYFKGLGTPPFSYHHKARTPSREAEKHQA